MNITKGKIMRAQKIVIYGPEGIGKSTFAAQFPNPLFTDTEGSTYGLDVNRFDRPTSEAMLIQQIEEVKKNPSLCSTYIIDTADWAERLCIKSVCDKYDKSGIEEFGYGKGYVFVNEDFGRILNLLEDLIELGINVVVVAHAAMRKFEQPDELGSYDRWELKLDKRNSPMLKEWADAVLFVNYKTFVEQTKDNKFKASGGKRVMYTAHHPCWDAKNRYNLPDETEFDYSVIAPFIPNSKPTAPAKSVQTEQKPADKPVERLIEPEEIKADAPTVEPHEIPAGLPRALVDLMKTNNVTEEDIRLAVSQRGYFPFETPIKNYGEEFINGCLIAAWDSVYSLIMSNKDLPFTN